MWYNTLRKEEIYMPNRIKPICLTEEEKIELENILKQPTLEARMHYRSKILLLKNESKSNEFIADKLDVSVATVRLCIKKFKDGGVQEAINDTAGRGRKTEITDADITWIIDQACIKPKDLGYELELWYPQAFKRHINSKAEEAGYPRLATISEPKIRTILKEAKLRPFTVSYYCEKRDPKFEEKMHNVLVVYKQVSMQFDEDGNLIPFEGEAVHTISYDEKPGMQAIESKAKDLPPIPNTKKNSTVMRDYEYIRHGTLSLLGGIDLLTGEVIPLISKTHKSSDFVNFLKVLDSKYPSGDKIRIVLDNHSAHTSKETQCYLNTIPGRFQFVFTPTHGSWLNLVEGFFSKLTKQMLKGIRVSSSEELELRIYKYIDEINKDPIPYKWSYKLDEINLANENIDEIIYEVVNLKAATKENQNKRAPEPIKRGRKKKTETQS